MAEQHGPWTAALVLRGLRLAFTDAPRLGEPPASFRFILECARELLGKDSPEFGAARHGARRPVDPGNVPRRLWLALANA
jgi:hypothetical protein